MNKLKFEEAFLDENIEKHGFKRYHEKYGQWRIVNKETWDEEDKIKTLRISTFSDLGKFKFFYDRDQDGLLFPVIEVRKIVGNGHYLVYTLGKQDPETLRHELGLLDVADIKNQVMFIKE